MKAEQTFFRLFSNHKFHTLIATLLIGLLLTACGGSGANDTFSSQLSTSPTNTLPVDNQTTTITPTSAEACIMWSYDTSAVPNLAGFRIYDGAGNLLYETSNTDSMHVDFQVTLTADQMTFTMTAFDADGNESAHSAPYTVVRG